VPRRVPFYRPAHQATAARAYETTAERLADKRFYAGARWIGLRALKLATDPLCEVCRARGDLTPAGHVHHKQPRKQRPDLAYEWSNLESVCPPCHNAKGADGGAR
jgi:5-methylcytosine-specific restriction enzyme A